MFPPLGSDWQGGSPELTLAIKGEVEPVPVSCNDDLSDL
jgi:hypothetical protein